MRSPGLLTKTVLLACFLGAPTLLAGQSKSTPGIPQTFPPPEPDRPHLQVDQPPTVAHGDRRVVVSPAQVKQDADELAKLSQSIPADMDKVAKGVLPQDLASRLKRIEKLSKELRRDIGQ
jgi:hypothetical protein